MRKNIIFLFLFFYTAISAQSITDTVHHIPKVDVLANRIFKKEEAGMKKTPIDSLVLVEKINLSLSELLSENTPIFIKSHGRGALATASFRGTAASHTQVSWNGMSINSPMTGSVDFSLIPGYIVDELNLLHGNASIANNSGGLGGAISIKNSIDWSKNFGFKLLQGIGSYSTYDEYVSLQLGNKKFQSKSRIYFNYSKNDYKFLNRLTPDIDFDTGEYTYSEDKNKNADYRKYGILQELYWRPYEKDIISLKWWFQKSDRSIPTVISLEGDRQTNSNRDHTIDHKLLADWNHYLKSGKITARSGISFKDMDYIFKRGISGKDEFTTVYSKSKEHSWLNNIGYNQEINSFFSLESSLDFNYFNVSSRDSVKKEGYKKERYEASLLIGAKMSIVERLNLNLMIRNDIIDGDLKSPIPYLGFDYKPLLSMDLIVKGNIGRNYHQPSLNDLYWQPGGNPNLKAEKGFSYEVGIEYLRKINNHHIKAEFTAYHSDINDWIIWIPTPKGYWQPLNIKQVESTGYEINLNINGKINQVSYNISPAYAYTKSLNYGEKEVWGDESYGKQLVYVPLHSGNLYAHLEYKGFFASYQFNSYSERFTTTSNNLSKRNTLYPYIMNNLSIGRSWLFKNRKLTAELKIFNLLNEEYHTILIRPMPKRNYLFQITYQI